MSTRTHRFSLVLLLILPVCVAVAATKETHQLPIKHGHWVAKKAGCTGSTELYFDYKGKTIDFEKFACQIKKIRHYGGIRYLVDMSCKSSSLQFDDTIAFDIARDKSVFLHYPNIGSNSDEFTLCKQLPRSGQTVVAKKKFTPKARLSFQSSYQGNVGKSLIDVSLNYYQDGTVIGKYVTQQLGNVYQLKGDNRTDGVLKLKEYTNGRHTANVELHKNVRDGKLAWIGKMHNLDGRVVDVVFVKAP